MDKLRLVCSRGTGWFIGTVQANMEKGIGCSKGQYVEGELDGLSVQASMEKVICWFRSRG